ncbi:pre-mRNA splicing factor CWC24 [Scheffersomyces coipomensis]|uniref:pre-mRNA splicing factor CWC24 n=1 Tax=Scheffersomyces coipomensis TaxID=1788519 RepID=UPI00315C6896
MFKKRVIKDNDSNKASTVKSSKRSFLLETEDDENSPIIEKSNLHSSDPFKKRQKLAVSKKSNTSTQPVTVAIPSGTNKKQDDSDEEEEIAISTKSKIKPLPTNITVTTLTDFQPDVCKDFLQTGYCGYGDTCKFLHIRDESKANKVIEKEWETVGSNTTKLTIPTNKDTSEKLPFKCVLCKSDYKHPIKTKCGHLYCKDCFLNRYKKKKKVNCFICNEDTNGIIIPVSKTELEKLIS